MNRKCNSCDQLKSLDEFPKDKKSKTGYSYRCSECNKQNKREWYKNNKSKVESYSQKYYKENKEARIDYQKTRYSENKERILEKNRDWAINNKEKINKARRLWRSLDTEASRRDRLKNNLRKRIIQALRRGVKSASTMELIGCDIEHLIKHLESQFRDGMSWDNYGIKGWHIDHIIPCNAFNLWNPEEQKKCFHYTNLQPLWASENLAKSDRIPSSNNTN